MVRLAGLDVEEIVLPLRGDGATAAVKAVSPNGMVPYLEHQGARLWESLAIAEYCAEFQPALWPAERVARGHARSIAAEMHAGFRALRLAMPMNLGRSYQGLGRSPDCLSDIDRIDRLMVETRARFGGDGPFLFGETYNAADAMFAPVVARFITYGAAVSATTAAYCQAVRAQALVSLWYELAAQEPQAWLLDKYETLA
jgi:glutathione S-transferase